MFGGSWRQGDRRWAVTRRPGGAEHPGSVRVVGPAVCRDRSDPGPARRAEARRGDGRHDAECQPARAHQSRRGRWGDPVRGQRHHEGGARCADPAPPPGGDRRRPAAAPDRGRPGRRRHQADPVGAADAVAGAARSPGIHGRGPFAGARDREGPAGPRDRHRPRTSGRRAGVNRVLPVPTAPDLVVLGGPDDRAGGCLRGGPSGRRRGSGPQALPRSGVRDPGHRPADGHDSREPGRPRPGPRDRTEPRSPRASR